MIWLFFQKNHLAEGSPSSSIFFWYGKILFLLRISLDFSLLVFTYIDINKCNISLLNLNSLDSNAKAVAGIRFAQNIKHLSVVKCYTEIPRLWVSCCTALGSLARLPTPVQALPV